MANLAISAFSVSDTLTYDLLVVRDVCGDSLTFHTALFIAVICRDKILSDSGPLESGRGCIRLK